MPKLGALTRVARELRQDARAVQDRDPAARGLARVEILLTYGGVHALLAHRVAHVLHEAGVPLIPHAIAYVAKLMTGVEIHPGARIGEGLFIDHGAGVVIGQTAEVGDNVTLYQQVTLGGTGFAPGKRHPTVEDDVVVGSGAKLLGPIRVGRGAKVGANSVVIHDVPPNSTVVGNPGHPVRVDGKRPIGPDADWAHLPDPVADAIKALSARVTELEQQLAEATGREHEPPPAEVRPLREARGGDPAGG
jgi:serine O-acetyltransferase